jgi:hypothetical protein
VLELPLSPPRNPKIDGQDAYQDVTVATQTPTFSWEAPARGTPSRYSVAVYRVANPPELIVTTVLRGTSFKLRPGNLSVGQRYVAIITADNQVVEAPLAVTLPHAWAQTITGAFVW